jgi:hypothetical protein
MFASQFVAPGVPQTLPEDEITPTPAADASPENPPAEPGTEETTGEESNPETTPPEADQDPQPEGKTDEDVLSQPEDQISAAAAGLDETQRTQLLDMLKSVKEGGTSWKDIKQGHKAWQQYAAEMAAMKQQVEELKAAGGSAPAEAGPAEALPEHLTKLKTADEVNRRMALARANVRQIEKFLDRNPDGGEVDGKQFTREQVIASKHQWQDELEVLPQLAATLTRRSELARARAEASVQIARDFPEFNDPENPDTKLARQLLADPRFAQEVNGDYMALAMAAGHRLLQEKLKARKAPAKPAAKPQGKVPAGKPHAAAGAAPSRAAAGPSSRDLIARVQKENSRQALSALLATTTVG